MRKCILWLAAATLVGLCDRAQATISDEDRVWPDNTYEKVQVLKRPTIR